MVYARAERVITTGNVELDKKIGGGLPIGSLTLIEGGSDSGKSSLSQQMIWGSLKDDQRVSLLTTENTPKSLITQMKSLGLDVIDYYFLGRLKIYPLHTSSMRQELVQGLYSLLNVIGKEINDVIFVDSITGFIDGAPTDDVVSFFETAKIYCSNGKTIVIVIHSVAAREEFTITRVRSICDAHLVLRTVEEGGRLMKILEVAKVRGAQKSTGTIWGFDVEPKRGIRIIPIRKVRV